jgi:hypothetical protein
MILIRPKQIRAWLKQVDRLNRQIADEHAHALGHKEKADKLKIERDRIYAEIDAYKAAH